MRALAELTGPAPVASTRPHVTHSHAPFSMRWRRPMSARRMAGPGRRLPIQAATSAQETMASPFAGVRTEAQLFAILKAGAGAGKVGGLDCQITLACPAPGGAGVQAGQKGPGLGWAGGAASPDSASSSVHARALPIPSGPQTPPGWRDRALRQLPGGRSGQRTARCHGGVCCAGAWGEAA